MVSGQQNYFAGSSEGFLLIFLGSLLAAWFLFDYYILAGDFIASVLLPAHTIIIM